MIAQVQTTTILSYVKDIVYRPMGVKSFWSFSHELQLTLFGRIVYSTPIPISKRTNENKMLKWNEDQIASNDDASQINNTARSNMRNMQPQEVLQMQPSVHLLKSPMKTRK